MPAAGGPNTLGESNLVFAYDTGDVSNSYKGQPTVNVLPSSNVLLTSYNDHGGTHVTDTGFTLFGNATLRNTSNPAQYWNGVYLTGLSSILTPGVTYTYSFYIYFTSDNTTISYFGYGAPGYTGVKGRWNRVSTTFTATSQDYFYVTLQYSNGQPVSTYYLANLQIEQKSNPTSFVNGTRSATQGLLTLVGTDTIDLTNMSFDSNAKMLFDGTNDYVSIPTYTFGNGNWSLSMLVNANDFANFNLMSNTSGGPVTNAFGAYSNKIFYYNYDGSWQSHSGNTTLSTGTWYMLTWVNYAGAAANLGTMQMFVNGIADTSVFNSYTTNGGPCNAIGANWYSSFNGRIDAVQIYNKSLTSAEIKQNYQQYKTRFNLS